MLMSGVGSSAGRFSEAAALLVLLLLASLLSQAGNASAFCSGF